MNGKKYYYICMENVYLGVDMKNPNIKIYDLKGS
jgi:hypothetical protein